MPWTSLAPGQLTGQQVRAEAALLDRQPALLGLPGISRSSAISSRLGARPWEPSAAPRTSSSTRSASLKPPVISA